MTTCLEKHFNKEQLLSERLRLFILIGLFSFGLLFTSAFCFFSSQQGMPDITCILREKVQPFIIFMILFESMFLFYVLERIKRGFLMIPPTIEILNCVVEVSMPSVIMFIAANNLADPASILHSPVVNIYFLLILISTLRLKPAFSMSMGILAGTEFLILGFYLNSNTLVHHNDLLRLGYGTLATKVAGIVMAGLAAGFVATQIKNGINRFIHATGESNKIMDVFSKQISKEVAEKIMDDEGLVQSRILRVCVVFVDIRNFSNFVSDKSPSEIVEFQNAFFSIVIDVVTRHKGVINQFLGDGCMITFGAPVPMTFPSLPAIEAVIDLKQELSAAIVCGKIPFTEFGVGIHVGDAVTGNIGTNTRQQYSVTGNVVIMASRLEQLNKKYKSSILASEEVICEGRDLIRYAEDMGEVIMKGWSKPVRIFKLA